MKKKYEIIQFHQNYSYEDFIMGYRPVDTSYKLTNGIFYEFCQKAAKAKKASENNNQPAPQYYFIIDEINRGNLSKIFGEVFMLIEKDKRGEKNAIPLMYSGAVQEAKAPSNGNNPEDKDPFEGGKKFYIPENVKIIGTMNTADRSIAMMDFALRRRFAFIDIEPDYSLILNDNQFKYPKETIKVTNEIISKDPALGDGFRIGHSYFIKIGNHDELKQALNFEIIPMLKEYAAMSGNNANLETVIKIFEKFTTQKTALHQTDLSSFHNYIKNLFNIDGKWDNGLKEDEFNQFITFYEKIFVSNTSQSD